MQGYLAYRQGELERAADCLDDALRSSEENSRIADAEFRGYLQLLRAFICLELHDEGGTTDCEPVVLNAWETLRSTSDLNSIGMARFLLASVRWSKGDVEGGYADAQAALLLHVEADTPDWIAIDCGLLARMSLVQDPERAIEYAQQAREAAARTGDEGEILDARLRLADVLLARGLVEDAEREFLEVASIIDALGRPELLGARYALGARIEVERERPVEAAALHERAAAAFEETEDFEEARWHVDRAWSILERSGSHAEAAEVLRRYCDVLMTASDHHWILFALKSVAAGLQPEAVSELFSPYVLAFQEAAGASCAIALRLTLSDVYRELGALDLAREQVLEALRLGRAQGLLASQPCVSSNDCICGAALYPVQFQVEPLGVAVEEVVGIEATTAFYEDVFAIMDERVDPNSRIQMTALLRRAYESAGNPLMALDTLRRGEPAYRETVIGYRWPFDLVELSYEEDEELDVRSAKRSALLEAGYRECAIREALGLARLLYRDRGFDEARKEALEAVRISCGPEDSEALWTGCREAALQEGLKALTATWESKHRVAFLAEAAEVADSCSDGEVRLAIHEELLRVHEASGDLQACLASAIRAVAVYRSAGRLESLIASLSSWSDRAESAGDVDLALEFHRRALFLAEEQRIEPLRAYHLLKIEILEGR